MSARFSRLRSRRGASPSQGRIVLGPHEVRRVAPDGAEEALPWAELREVRIVSRPAPSLSQGVVFELIGENGTLRVPRPEATQDLIDRLQELPGFDTEALIEAIGSTDAATFVCWRVPGVED